MLTSNSTGSDTSADTGDPGDAHREAMLGGMDALLAALFKIPPDAKTEAAVSQLLHAVSDSCPDILLGVLTLSEDRHPMFITREATTYLRPGEAAERFFPETVYERTIPTGGDSVSVLHAGAASLARLDRLNTLLTRLAMALGITLRMLQLNASSKSQSQAATDLKTQLIQNQKLASIGQLTAGVLHELNNPLTSIIAYSEYLHKKYKNGGGDEADIERLGRIEEAAKRILGFTRSLTDYARPARDEHTPISIRDIIERALVFCEHVFDEFGVAVNTSFEDVPPVRGTSGQLMQVFVNLFTNAAHAMRDRGGHLSVGVAGPRDTNEITITIADEGHGVEPAHLDLIFKPFFTTKSDGTGTGLGLSIVQEIVTRHGGRIRVSSCTNQGTVFTIDLPVAEPA